MRTCLISNLHEPSVNEQRDAAIYLYAVSTAIHESVRINALENAVHDIAVWLLHEQVSVAALSIGQVEVAAQLIRAVAKKFPGSQRANRLKVG